MTVFSVYYRTNKDQDVFLYIPKNFWLAKFHMMGDDNWRSIKLCIPELNNKRGPMLVPQFFGLCGNTFLANMEIYRLDKY